MTDHNTQTNAETHALACNIFALTEPERSAHFALSEALFTQDVQERRELPDGYAFSFAASEFPRVAAFVANERRCCPFLTFGIDVPPGDTVMWLRLTGNEHVKAFIGAEFNL